MKILIGADIVPTTLNIEKFSSGDRNALLGEELAKEIDSADFMILNLETPLTDTETPIEKCGPCLVAPEKCIKGIKAINPYFFTLANNHILDQGTQGLETTMRLLNENEIAYAGVGENLSQMNHSYIKKIKDKIIGIYCCAEHEFSIATEHTPGANPYDPLESFDHVEALKEKCDYVIVLYHGGKEFYRYPSPNLQKIFRKFADKGADIVVAQHTHCVGCKEEYKSSTLIYGQGNFFFNKKNDEFWNTSLLISVESGDHLSIKYIPLVQTEYGGVRIANSQEKNDILAQFYKRSNEILNTDFIKTNYEKFAIEKISEYIVALGGNRFWDRCKRKICQKWLLKKYNSKCCCRIFNFVTCESHHELIKMGILYMIFKEK
jgi:poly-gamma-glutamate synthesis protein (capsule biosynthesis protein)